MFGLEITKKQKILVFTGVPIGVMCFLFYLLLALFEGEGDRSIAMPTGGLTSSIFDSQNQTYKGEEALKEKHSFQQIPYTIDTVDGAKAMVGNGSIYEHAPFYFYYSELKKHTDLETVLKEELSSVLLYGANPSLTDINVLYEEKGFVNGCEAVFYVMEVTAKKDTENVTQYVALYRLHLDASVYETEWEMLVGCMSGDYSTEGLLALKTLSFSSVGSLKLDETAKKRIEGNK